MRCPIQNPNSVALNGVAQHPMDHHPPASTHSPEDIEPPCEEPVFPMPPTLKADVSYPPAVALTMQFWIAAPAAALNQHINRTRATHRP